MALVCLLIPDETGNGQGSLHSTVWGQHCSGTALFKDGNWLGTALAGDSTVWGQPCLRTTLFGAKPVGNCVQVHC